MILRVLLLVALISVTLARKAPNILILVADDMGYGDLGCYGNTTVRTPNMDSIAADGIKLTQHLTAASTCTPSRAALLTGRYPVRTGMAPQGIMRVNLWPYSRSGLPESEWHMGLHRDNDGDNKHHPLNQGFNYFYGLIGTNLDDFGHEYRVITMIRPHWYGQLISVWGVTTIALWCLMKFGYFRVTTFLALFLLWTAPIYFTYFLMDNMELFCSVLYRNYDLVEQPIRLAGLSQRFVHEGLEFMRNATDTGEPFLLVMSWVHMHVAIKTAKQFQGKSPLGRYGDGMEELDWSVGEIMKGLKDAGVEDNTLVYFTSDNGGKSHGAVDGGIRVPGMVKWPGHIRPGSVTDEPTFQMDVVPLISHVTGVALPTDRKYDGKNMMPLLTGEITQSPHEFMFHYCGNKLHAVRYRPGSGSRTWKYVTHEPQLLPGKSTCRFICSCTNAVTLTTPKLYDVTSDPGETSPIDAQSETYTDISELIQKAVIDHKSSLDPVESQFSWFKLLPQIRWQPCCNGSFPFNCDCQDPKFS
ncbi:STS-like protein [Mya arenaria]|uniref:STS-like protein n=1 Tax=Mya arenaria TaxID=6604 RepID=A0ABY7FDE5_MYAAR|nr:STS-like protein [Mya arenaria]